MARENISIVVLTYNRKRLLCDCLQSLLAQTYPPDKLEILVSDDGSRDGTRELVERLQAEHAPRLKYLHQPHRGIAAARNNGIVHATAEIVAIVADDYILDSDYATTIAQFFHQHPDAKVVRFKVIAARNDLGSRISHFYFDVSVRRRLSPVADSIARNWSERIAQVWQKIPPFEETITTRHNLEAAGAAAFRREVFARAGLFDESLQRAEDTDMTKRLRELGIAVYYYPYQRIKHQYNPFLLDTLHKCFYTGFNRYKFYQKHEFSSDNGRGVLKTIILHKIGMILDALWRSRQAKSTLKVLLYLPFMLLFEATNKLGFLCSVFRSRFQSRKSRAQRAYVRLKDQVHLTRFTLSAAWDGGPQRWDKTVILFFNPPWGKPLNYPEPEIPDGCEITTDRRRFREAAAVVFHLTQLNGLKWFRKSPDQLWVAWWMECEAHYPHIRDARLMRLFDLTMSHHQTADIFTPYCRPEILSTLRTPPQPKTREKLAAFFVSAPYNQSRRLEYAAELMKHMNVHSYGRRMRNQLLVHDLGRQTKLKTIANYKFTLAFENATDEDYVTEKFFQPLEVGSVPVYLGAPNIDQFAPGDRCFINTADFPSPKALAEYLLMLNENDAAYEEYFAWKASPFRPSFLRLTETQRVHEFVRLCRHVQAHRLR
jgi:glycosyltransferase involved in cell wall biosynthesis